MSQSEPTRAEGVAREEETETIPPIDALADGLTDHHGTQADAAETARTLAAVDPEAAAPLVDPLVAVATESTPVAETATRRAASHALVRIGRAHPEAVAPHADTLAALVDASEGGVAENAAGICAVLAEVRPDAVAAVREGLLALLERGGHATTLDVLDALGTVAETDPGAVRPALERLCRLLDAEATDVASAACRALGPLARTDAERLASHDGRFAAMLAREDHDCRAAAGRTLARAITVAPTAFPQSREHMVALLGSGKPSVRRAGADAVVSLAQTDPDAFANPDAVARELRQSRRSLPLGPRSEDAVAEALSALEESDPGH